MSLTPAEAQSALKDIEKTENRAAASQHGRLAAPFLIMWGVVWVIGYLVIAAAPRFGWIWWPLIVGGVIGSIILGRQQSHARKEREGFTWRYAASFLIIAAFITALFAIMPPQSYNQVSAFYPLVIALYYAFLGIWTKGWRLLPLGLALGGLTVAGFFLLPDHFLYWMAGVGGGGLILGGLWLRAS